MSNMNCPKCGSSQFTIRLTSLSEDGTDVGGRCRFGISYALLAVPDFVEIEAICKGCAETRTVPDDEWEWT
jgi:hypothetical protein